MQVKLTNKSPYSQLTVFMVLINKQVTAITGHINTQVTEFAGLINNHVTVEMTTVVSLSYFTAIHKTRLMSVVSNCKIQHDVTLKL